MIKRLIPVLLLLVGWAHSSSSWATCENNAPTPNNSPCFTVNPDTCTPVAIPCSPLITTAGATLTMGCNPTLEEIDLALGTATASDNCGVPDPTPTTDLPVVTGTCQLSQTRRWNVIDNCDNPAAEVSRTVTWKNDPDRPYFTTCPGPINKCCGAVVPDLRSAPYNAKAKDDCSSQVDYDQTPAAGTALTCGAETTVTVKATDGCDNPGYCEVKVRAVKLCLNEVSFSGAKYHELKKDDSSGIYDAPHWKDASSPPDCDANDVGDRKYPVSFTRKTKMKVTAKWKIQPAIASIPIKIKGDGPGNLDFPETVAANNGTDVTITDVECQNDFEDKIRFIDPLTITWQFSVDDGVTWCEAGTSANPVYLIWDDPKQANPIYTLVHTGCTAADTQGGVVGTDDDKVLDKVWTKLQTKSIRRASDNMVLSYYGFFDANGNGVWDAGDTDRNSLATCSATTAATLISTGNGQCGAWDSFMNETLKAQGLDKIYGVNSVAIQIAVKSPPDVYFGIKDWATSGNKKMRFIISFDAGIDGSAPSTPNANSDEAADAKGVPGQGNSPNPPSKFNGHAIGQFNGKYYDPSYGSGPFTDRKVYENNALKGGITSRPANVSGSIAYFLVEPKADNGNPNNHADELVDYSVVAFP